MAEAIKVTRGGVYVPDWGNADREDAEKIRIHYRFLSFEEQQQLLTPEDLGKNFAYESRVLAKMVTKVENLEVDDGKKRTIDTGENLVSEPGLDGLALELWIEFRNKSAIDKKKSE
jgi:hypothetical protein